MAAPADDRNRLNSYFAPLKPTSRPRRETNDASTRPKRKDLPEGACNYRDLGVGPKPPNCGCRRFWCLVQQELGSVNGQELYCACGHHACFHATKLDKATGQSTESSPESRTQSSIVKDAPVRGQLQSEIPTQDWLNRGQFLPARHLGSGFVPAGGQRDDDTNLDISGVQPIPSFNLTSAELRGYNNYTGSIGLGLNFQRGLPAARFTCGSPTVADAASVAGAADYGLIDSQRLPSTRQASMDGNSGPDGAFMQHIRDGRRMGPPLDAINTKNAITGLGLGDIIQSATDVATPSVSATPDIRQLVQEANRLVNTIHGEPTGKHIKNSDRFGAEGVIGSHAQGLVVDVLSADAVQTALQKFPGALERLAPLLSQLHSQLLRNPDISVHESINSLTTRMDALENASFNQIAPEQVHEQFQHMDVRLLDVENNVFEHGRLLSGLDPDDSSRRSRSKRPLVANANTSFASHASGQSLDSATSSALIAAAIDRVDAESRLKVVEERLDGLETMQMPSASLPWEVDVVLLPWGHELRGIWHTADDLTKPGTTQEDEDWTQAKSHQSGSRPSISLGESGWSEKAIHQWAAIDDDTLWAKACGTNGVVYHRLRSRGLVRKITLTSSGARDVVNTICKTFGEVLKSVSAVDEDSQVDDDDEDVPLGLTAPFVPLRKVHKSSRLRFLTSSELVTPALWTADFLAAGVLMRAPAGQKRLFVTTAAAYNQQSASPTAGWTWPRLREMPRVHDPDSQKKIGDAVPEADAKEPCWKHHPALDGISSPSSSFHGQIVVEEPTVKLQELSAQRADNVVSSSEESQAEDELAFHQPITPVSEFPPTQRSPLYHRRTRTLSIPFSDPIVQVKQDSFPQLLRPTSQQGKRRIRSFEQAANPDFIAALPTIINSPSRGLTGSMRIKKKRRVIKSRSVSSGAGPQIADEIEVESLHSQADPGQVLMHLQSMIPSGGVIKSLGQFEPRKGGDRDSSPFFEADAASESTSRVVQARAAEKRGVTPSAYATPFSGTVAGFGAGDDESMGSSSGEDWAGVDEGEAAVSDDDDEEMEDEQDILNEGSEFSTQADSDEGFYDEDQDDEMVSSSEDELQVS